MAVSNEFVFYKAGCTQNKENCIYPHKVVVTNAQEFNEMAKFDHVCAEYRGNYRGNSNFMPKSNVGNRKYRSSTLTPEVYQNYERLIQNLLADEPTNAPEVITLSDEADKLLEQFAEELEPKLKTEYSDIADWAGKLGIL